MSQAPVVFRWQKSDMGVAWCVYVFAERSGSTGVGAAGFR